MLRNGYEKVTIDDIARRAGIGRTTFFRHFKTKPSVVWAAFEEAISLLTGALEDSRGNPDVLDAVRLSVRSSISTAIYASDVWLERFRLLDSSPELRADAHEHWERWGDAIAAFVATRTGQSRADAISMGIAGAARGVVVSVMRSRFNENESREDVLDRLDSDLSQVLAAMGTLVTAA